LLIAHIVYAVLALNLFHSWQKGCEIIVVNHESLSLQEEMIEDLMAMIHKMNDLKFPTLSHFLEADYHVIQRIQRLW